MSLRLGTGSLLVLNVGYLGRCRTPPRIPCKEVASMPYYGRTPITAEQRFWNCVDTSTGPDSCWIWTGNIVRRYGQISYGGKMWRAHRLSYLLHHGSIPENVLVLHNCPDGDNPLCVNPRHLWLGTNADNTQDAANKNRMAYGERSPMAKISTEDARAIFMLCGTMSQQKIADLFGINQAAVSSIHLRQTWRRATENL